MIIYELKVFSSSQNLHLEVPRKNPSDPVIFIIDFLGIWALDIPNKIQKAIETIGSYRLRMQKNILAYDEGMMKSLEPKKSAPTFFETSVENPFRPFFFLRPRTCAKRFVDKAAELEAGLGLKQHKGIIITLQPPKTNMEPENGPLKQEDSYWFHHHFQVLC